MSQLITKALIFLLTIMARNGLSEISKQGARVYTTIRSVIDTAIEKGDVKYRFVIDMASLKNNFEKV